MPPRPRARRFGARAADIAMRLNFDNPHGRAIEFFPGTPARTPRRPVVRPLTPATPSTARPQKTTPKPRRSLKSLSKGPKRALQF